MVNYKDQIRQMLGDVPMRGFAVLVDGEFAMAITMVTNSIEGEGNAIALASDPKIVEITHLDTHPEPAAGWMWNGTDFDAPAGE